MTIAMGAADGTQWRFIVQNPAWVTGHVYTALATVTPSYFELSLDGQLLGHVDGGFSPLPNQNLVDQLRPQLGRRRRELHRHPDNHAGFLGHGNATGREFSGCDPSGAADASGSGLNFRDFRSNILPAQP